MILPLSHQAQVTEVPNEKIVLEVIKERPPKRKKEAKKTVAVVSEGRAKQNTLFVGASQNTPRGVASHKAPSRENLQKLLMNKQLPLSKKKEIIARGKDRDLNHMVNKIVRASQVSAKKRCRLLECFPENIVQGYFEKKAENPEVIVLRAEMEKRALKQDTQVVERSASQMSR